MNEYNLCSLLIHSQAKKMTQVKSALLKYPGTEVHASTEDCRLIVTLEAASRKIIAQQILDIQQIEGVLSAAMIYQFSDDLKDDDIETSDIDTKNMNKLESAQKRMSA